MLRPLYTTLLCFSALIIGVFCANALVKNLELTVNTEREYLVSQVSNSLRPMNRKTVALQNSIYQQRVIVLDHKIKQAERKTKSIQQYIEPLEQELTEYRMTFSEKAAASQDERLQLYIDLVSKYRDYQRAMSSFDTFIPLEDSDSVLSIPSVQLDLVYRAGGALASTHNNFVNEERDSSFAAHYESQLRRFLAVYKLDTMLVDCRTNICAVHLGMHWEDPYFQGFIKIWQDLQQQPWMNLKRIIYALQVHPR